MDGPYPGRTKFLDDLLRIMVAHWGADGIRRKLNQLAEREDSRGERIAARMRIRSALAYAKAMNLAPEKKEIINKLADRFDNKSFLPTIGDLRNFLELQRVPAIRFKNRTAAIPIIMGLLAELSDTTLQKICEDARYAGPAQLGPLSDAIRAASARTRAAE